MGWNVDLPAAEYFSFDNPAALEPLVREIEDQKAVAIDTETDGLTLWKCLPHYWSLSWRSGENSNRVRRLMMPAHTLHLFKNAFNDLEKKWVFANAKFDMHMLANAGIHIKGHLVDTQVMHSLLYEEMPHGLKDMAHQLLGWKWTDFMDTFGTLRKGYCACGGTQKSHLGGVGFCKKTGCMGFRQITPLDLLQKMAAQDMDKLVDYASNDAYGTWMLYEQLNNELAAEATWSLYPTSWPYINTMHDYFYRIEMPFTRVLYTCERNGVMVDKKYLEDLTPNIMKDVAEIRKEIVREAGYMLNPSSNPQLREYFFGKLKLAPMKFSKGGASGVRSPSVDEKFLEAYDDIPVAALILKLHKIEKQFSTYIEKMPGRLDRNDRVHMRLNQDVARTGRLSSSDPNMQNITGGEKDIYNLRRAFISGVGRSLIVADYSQLEMRLLAAASMEPKMCQIFKDGLDIHMGNASMVFNIPYEDFVKAKKIDKLVKQGELPESEMTDFIKLCMKLRSDIKTIGFGLNYGMKAKALAKRIGCDLREAIEKTDQYMGTYPAVKEFFDDAVNEARETGFAFTILGRRRRLSGIMASGDMDRWQAERQASNMPIQGTAADVCKMAMILIHDDQLDRKYDCHMLLQVHDELVFECPSEAVPLVKPIIREWMEHPFPNELSVPLEVEIGHGPSWGNAK